MVRIRARFNELANISTLRQFPPDRKRSRLRALAQGIVENLVVTVDVGKMNPPVP